MICVVYDAQVLAVFERLPGVGSVSTVAPVRGT